MAKFSFIVRPLTVTFETTTIGQGETSRIRSVPHSIEWGGVECCPELSVQEMAQLALSHREDVKSLREFLRSELPDDIRNVGKALLELKEAFEIQQLQQDKRQFQQNQELFGDDEKSVHRIVRVWSDNKKKKD
jgi:hypothetical protein